MEMPSSGIMSSTADVLNLAICKPLQPPATLAPCCAATLLTCHPPTFLTCGAACAPPLQGVSVRVKVRSNLDETPPLWPYAFRPRPHC